MLLVADLHFTDKIADEYRFDVFDFILNYYKKTEDKNVLILGDITDFKDHHSSILVNRMVTFIRDLVEHGMEVFILKGNHDYIDPDLPFFQFLEQIEYVTYIKDPCAILIQGQTCLFLPHTRNPVEEWGTNTQVQKWKKKSNLVFIHQSVIGSVTSSGYEMERGLTPSYFKHFGGQVFAGDIHVPQVVGDVEYVGSPYSIRFNDNFPGGAIALTSYPYADCGTSVKNSDLLRNYVPTKLRCRRTIDIETLEDLQRGDACADDQVKVRLHVTDEAPSVVEIREACEELGFELCSIIMVKQELLPMRRKKKKRLDSNRTPTQIVESFGGKKGLTKAHIKIGTEIAGDHT